MRKVVGSSPDPSTSLTSSGTLGTLRREGIAPSSSARVISNSSFGKPIIAPRNSSIPDKRLQILEQRHWIGLGEGWFQATMPNTGSTSRCGLHSIIESTTNQCFICAYIPRSKASYQAVVGPNAEFDLELAIKLYSKDGNQSTLAQVIVAMKSPDDYCMICCDAYNKIWSFVHIIRDKEILVSQAVDESLRCNIFYNLLIQVRCNSISLDVNGVPLFTNIRVSGVEEFGGLLGLCAKVISLS